MSGRRPEPSYSGDLQTEVMAAAWRLGEATVEQVREQLPSRRRSAYNTIQTVMNRLVDRGLLRRERRGPAYVYRPAMEESDYLARSIGKRLARATPGARRDALVSLVDGLEPSDLDEIARYANRIKRRRGKT